MVNRLAVVHWGGIVGNLWNDHQKVGLRFNGAKKEQNLAWEDNVTIPRVGQKGDITFNYLNMLPDKLQNVRYFYRLNN